MPPQELAIAMPGTEEMTETGIGLAGAAVTGVLEGVIIKIAPQLGVLETPFTWATLLGFPIAGIAGALMVKGMLGEAFKGVAYASTGYAASVIPAMVIPEGVLGRRAPPSGLRQVGGGQGVKQLPSGPLGAPQRAQAQAAQALLPQSAGRQAPGNPGTGQAPGNPGTGQLPANAGFIPIVADETVLV